MDGSNNSNSNNSNKSDSLVSGKRRYTYQAIMLTVETGVEVSFPDLEGAVTAGETFEEAVSMAADLLETYLSYLIDTGARVPQAHYSHSAQDGAAVAFFTVEAPIDEPTTMPVSQAAGLLDVTPRRVNAMIKSGLLTAIKAGRDNYVTIASVDACLAKPRRPGRPTHDLVSV